MRLFSFQRCSLKYTYHELRCRCAAGVFLAETVRSNNFLNRSSADAFDCYFELLRGAQPPPPPRWRAVLLQLQSTIAYTLRCAWLSLLFAPILLTAPLVLYNGWQRQAWIELLRATLEQAGPCFQKWAQWAATRHDLFPPDLCEELSKLHTQVSPLQQAAFSAFSVSFHAPCSKQSPAR